MSVIADPSVGRGVLVCVALALLVSCSPGEERSPADRIAARHAVADLVFFNGTVLTMDPRVQQARAVAIREGRIVALGEDADIEPLTNGSTELVDLDGRILIPALLDARDPDGGRVPPVCIDPASEGVVPEPPADQGPSEHAAEGVVGRRLPTVSVDALPALIARERASPSPMHLRIAHWPACGAGQRSRLQQLMRDLTEHPVVGRGSFRVAFEPEPAVVQASPDPAATATASGVPGVAPVAGFPDASPPETRPASMPPPLSSPWRVMAEAMRRDSSDHLAALRAFTSEAARSLGLEEETGMLAPGKRADLVVLDRNPLVETPERVAKTEVLQTWFGGERVFERGVERAP